MLHLNPDIAAVLSGARRWCVVTGDCLSILPTLPAGSVDAVVTDPPYGVGKAEWDAYFPRDWAFVARRAAKPDATWAVLTRAGHPMRDAIDVLGDLYQTTVAAWLCNGMTRGSISFGNWIAISVGGPRKWRPVQDVIRVTIRASEKVDGHPSPKPPDVMVQCVERFVEPDAVILDPFTGSGTTGVAAIKTGRRFIGIEIDEHYANVARERIAKAEQEALCST